MPLFPIQSVSDVITNSSTEIFVADITDNLLKNVKDFSGYGNIVQFKTYDDVLEFIKSRDYYVPTLEEYLRSYWEEQGFCFDYNSLFLDQYSMDFLMNKVGKTEKEVWDFYKDIYKPVLGKAFYSYEDDCGCTPQDIDIIESNFTFVTRY